MKRPDIDPRILVAMEACRPGSEDLSDPAMAPLVSQMAASRELDELYERLQKFDAALVSAYQDVPVPEGLAGRIVARLDAAQQSPSAVTSFGPLISGDALTEAISGTQAPDADLTGCPQSPARSPKRRWRRWMAGGLMGTAAMIAGIFCLISTIDGPRKPISAEQAVAQFRGQHEPGALLAEHPAPPDYPFSINVVFLSGARWRYVRDFQGSQAVAYDFTAPQGANATLYVLRGKVADLPCSPPLVPLNTQGCAVGRWQEPEAGMVYVLVVEGGDAEYRQFLQLSNEPIT